MHLKDKMDKIVLDGFPELIRESKRKLNKLCVNQRRECYNSYMQKWLHEIDIITYLTHNKSNLVVNRRFMKN